MFGLAMTARALVAPVVLGVAGAIFAPDGRVLLIKQSYTKGWRFPGGGVDRGEEPHAAVLRELAEEVGFSGGEAEFFGLYSRPAGWATNVVALYRVTGGTVAFRPKWEIREVCYADPLAPPEGTTTATFRRLKELTGALPKVERWQS